MTWREDCENQLEEIRALTDGWDGFRAAPIREDVISYAMNVLDSIMQPQTPAPHITPMSHSGLAMEWHIRGVNLEFEIEEPGSFSISFDVDEDGTS